MSLLFASGGQSIGASASVLAVNIQAWRRRLGVTEPNTGEMSGRIKTKNENAHSIFQNGCLNLAARLEQDLSIEEMETSVGN